MTNQHYMVIILCLLLHTFLLFKEIKRPNKRKLAARLIASTLAVVALACLAVPISWLKKRTVFAERNEAILLTEGYTRDSIESFLKKNKGNIPVYQHDSIAWIDSSLSSLHIFGYGLSGTDIDVLHPIPLLFHPSPADNGFLAVNWKQKLTSGEKLYVQGRFSNKGTSPVKIVLEGFHTALDSIMVPAQTNETFELKAFPKHIGKATFTLVVSDKNAVLEKNPVPVEVKAVDTLRILLLTAAPGFENKFLKNWLSGNGYAVASRTRISKNKFDESFSNMSSFGFEKITNSVLARVDILVSDASELAALSKTEQNAIREQVRENGMGLVVNADSIAFPGAFYASPFKQYFSPVKQIPVAIELIDPGNKTAPILREQNSFIRYVPGTQPLVRDSLLNILVSSCIEGSGKILFSVLQNTYTWMLAGHNSDYDSFWSYMLQEAGKKTGSERNLATVPVLPAIGEPVELYVETSRDALFRAGIGDDKLSLQQDPALGFQWQGIYWPEEAGWQPALQLGDQQLDWYAYGKSDWKNVSAVDKIRQTKKHLHNKYFADKKAGVTGKYVEVEPSPLYFLLIFIACCSFLWIEKKFSTY